MLTQRFKFSFQNSTFVNNSASHNGGVMYLFYPVSFNISTSNLAATVQLTLVVSWLLNTMPYKAENLSLSLGAHSVTIQQIMVEL